MSYDAAENVLTQRFWSFYKLRSVPLFFFFLCFRLFHWGFGLGYFGF